MKQLGSSSGLWALEEADLARDALLALQVSRVGAWADSAASLASSLVGRPSRVRAAHAGHSRPAVELGLARVYL